MKRKLFFLLALMLTSIGALAYQTPTADGIYYIQNVETGKFLCRGNDWGTRAVVSDFGSAWKLINSDGRYYVRVASLLEASVEQGIGDDYWMYADVTGDRSRTYALTSIGDGQYTMTGSGISMDVYAYTKDDAGKFCVAGNATLGDNMTAIEQSYWRFLSQSEYNEVIAGRISTQESSVASSAGYDLSTLGKTLSQLVGDVNSFANKGVQATVTATSGWTWTPEANRNGNTGTGNGLIEAFKAPGKFTKTVTDLTEGIYKVTIPALFRESNNAACYSLHESGYDPTGGCYISANGNTSTVSSWASGATSNNYPNSMAEAKARIDAGAYSNEVYCYVDNSGELNLEVGVPGFYEISQWVGSWFIMGDATATLYSDAVSDEDATAILATATALEDQEMDTDIKTALTTAKNTFDSNRTIANYNALQTAIENAQASADAYALFAPERTKALALGMSSEAIAAVAPDVNALKVAEYTFVTFNYSYGVSLGTWTTENAVERSGQHWDGTTGQNASTYSEQNVGWDQSSWSCSYSQDITLPAGKYVFKVAGRKSSDAVTLTLNVTNGNESIGMVNDFPNGDTGRGINTSGATDYATGEGHNYANGGNGRGWEWRYVQFTLDDPATVTVAVTGSANALYQWLGFCNPTVQTDDADNVALMEALVNLNSAKTAADGLTKNTTNVGDGIFQLDETTNNTLWTAFEDAKDDADDFELTSSSTAEEVNDLATALNTAVSNYKNQPLNAPAADKHYNIVVATAEHAKQGNAIVMDRAATYPVYSGSYISNNTGFTLNASATPNANYAQACVFTPVSGKANTYYITMERKEGTVYLTYGSLNDSKVNWKDDQIQATTESSKKGEFRIAATTTANVFNIVNTNNNNLIGCEDGGNIYTTNNKGDFTIAEATQATPNLTVVAGVNWATFMSPFAVNLGDLNEVEAYKVESVDGTAVEMTAVNGTIDANTPVLLYRATTGSNYKPELSGWGTAASDTYVEGLFTGSYVIANIPVNSYALQKKENVVGFYKVTSEGIKVGANRAYLTVSDDPGAREVFFLEDDATDINTIGEKAATTLRDLLNGADVYDLSGRKVNGALEKNKVYIVNGNKIYVK